MKKITLLCLLLAASFTFAQVNIQENFDAGTPAGWTDSYANTTSQTCAGNSERDNLYSGSATGNMTSPNQVGASNATDLIISFDYKVVDWSAATDATAPGWGMAELQYSVDDGATWTTVLTINDANHVTASTCATMMATIPAASLPAASDVKLQIANTWAAGDYYFYIDNFSAQQDLGCTAPAGTAVLGTLDCGAETFMVDIDITSLGDGAPVLDDGTTQTPITATGPYTAGPYPAGTAVVFTLLHGSVATCDVDLGSVIAYCAPPNDDCANATNIVPSATAAPVYITGTTGGNTASGEVTDADMSCVSAFAFGSGRDTWFKVEVPLSGEINVATQAAAGSPLDDTIVTVFSGACGGLVEVGCDDDNPTPSDLFSLVELTGQTPGDILLVRVQEYAADASRRGPDDGDFEITAYAADPSLGLEDVAFEGFKYFPNPVNGTLSLRAQDNIQAVSLYNMLGQEVLRATPNGLQDELDMSGLNTGAYFLKVRINDVEQNFRIIKD